MKTSIATIARTPGVTAWTLAETRTVERQRYLYATRPEARRAVERRSLAATLFAGDGETQGQSSVTRFGEGDLESHRLKQAVFLARLQSNRLYTLPPPATPTAVSLASPELAGDGVDRHLDELQERLYEAVARERQRGVRLASAEVFATAATTRLATSTGVRYDKTETTFLLDFVLLARDGTREMESHAARLGDVDVAALIAAEAGRARDALVAEAPVTRRGPVVLANGTFRPLFAPFAEALSGEAIYRGTSPVAVGAPLLGERAIRGEAPNLTSDPTLAWGGASTPFDGDGLALGRHTLVERGRIAMIAADKRHADYLAAPATGAWRNVVVPPGEHTTAALLASGDGPVLHIVEFSWLNPGRVRGRFATEIRLVYEIGPGGTRVVRAGSLSGNAYDAFAAARYARETELRDDYLGPVAIRFEDLQVTA